MEIEKSCNFDLVFIVTFVDLNNVYSLFNSVCAANKRVHLLIIVVAQNDIVINIDNYKTSFTSFFVLNNARRLSLSYARNIALRYICENDIMFNYIMFPDDDSSFDSAFFENYGKFVNGNTVIDVYCKNEKILFKPNNYDGGMLLMKGNYDAAMSVNMIIQRDTVNNVGLFDERMGVGSKYGSCEDSDYFIRCCEYSKHGFLYEKNLWNFHPKADDKYKNMRLSTLMRRYKNYGKGIIFLFDKHNMHVDAVKCVFSALAGSLFSLLRLNFKLAIARIYAFFVRGLFFINLLLKKNDSR